MSFKCNQSPQRQPEWHTSTPSCLQAHSTEHEQHAIRWEPTFHTSNCSSRGISPAQFICWVIFYMKCLPAHMKWASREYVVVVVEGVTTDHCDPAGSWLGGPCVSWRRESVFVLLYLESILREHWSSFLLQILKPCRHKKGEVCFPVLEFSCSRF